MSRLSANIYGKNRVRLVRVRRGPEATEFIEWTVRILFEGDYAAAYEGGDNSGVLPTDTMKNTVYALARGSGASAPEEFAMELAEHFLEGNPEAERVSVKIAEKPWEHLTVHGRSHPTAFRLAGSELRTASARGTRQGSEVRSGLRGLVIMKTADSGFEKFKKDRLTTLGETADRLLGTDASVDWGYLQMPASFRATRERVRETLLATFAGHRSRSVQHTLYAMGEAVLNGVPEVADLRLTMPNIHCLPVDLSRFGQDNLNEIFVPVDEPHGYIKARLRR